MPSQATDRLKFHKIPQFKKKTLKLDEEEYFYNGFLVHEFKGLHKDVIMDCIEIASPLLIATACIDKNIRLISLAEKKIMGVFMGHHKGVRHLHYTTY